MSEQNFDLIIVGTGSGNSIPGPQWQDKRIAIVEKGTFGGTCLNVGCIPTKMFVYPADVAREISSADKLSLSAELHSVEWQDIQRRVFANRIDPISASGEEYRRGDQTPTITLFSGTAAFSEPRTLTVTFPDGTTTAIRGDNIVLATGGRPFVPDVIANSGVRYHTNESIMRLPEQPKSVIIMGGGVSAVEFAHVFSALGTEVTVLNRSPRLLKQLDETVVERFNKAASTRWTNVLGREVRAAREEEDAATGRHQVVLSLDDGQEISAEVLYVALGRTPNSDLLNLAAGGVATADNGKIVVDEYGRTTADGVWALGDASSPYELKHVANAEMRVVNHNLLHPDDLRPFNHVAVPNGIFTNPQIATVGMTEAQAREEAAQAGHSITVKVQEYADVAYGWAMEDTESFVKLIANASTGRLVGAHIMGPQATTLIQQLITVMAFDLDVRLVAKNQYWPHPALSEVVENALLGLEISGALPEGLAP